jgi:hypothetical protein
MVRNLSKGMHMNHFQPGASSVPCGFRLADDVTLFNPGSDGHALPSEFRWRSCTLYFQTIPNLDKEF